MKMGKPQFQVRAVTCVVAIVANAELLARNLVLLLTLQVVRLVCANHVAAYGRDTIVFHVAFAITVSNLNGMAGTTSRTTYTMPVAWTVLP